MTATLPLHKRIIILTDGHSEANLAKTAISLVRYRTDHVVAVVDSVHAGKTTADLWNVPQRIPVVAGIDSLNADAIFVGIAPPGGKLPSAWKATLKQALTQGMDIVSGLHDFLQNDSELVHQAIECGQRLIDVRKNNYHDVASGSDFQSECVRLHTVGNDCSLGKMVTSLELQKGLQQFGYDARFAATGQTGIMIAGDGVPIDCVVADFVSGAAEQLILSDQDHPFVVVEGQGSICHPQFSAVTLGLLHGCAPDGLIFCYEADRTEIKGMPGFPIPDMRELIDIYEALANLRHPCKVIGLSANTRLLDDQAAQKEIDYVENRLGLPVCDVYRQSAKKLVDAAIKLRGDLSEI